MVMITERTSGQGSARGGRVHRRCRKAAWQQELADACATPPCRTPADKDADVVAEKVQKTIWESEIRIRINLGEKQLRAQVVTALIGQHNVYNVLAAIATGLALGVPVDTIGERNAARTEIAGTHCCSLSPPRPPRPSPPSPLDDGRPPSPTVVDVRDTVTRGGIGRVLPRRSQCKGLRRWRWCLGEWRSSTRGRGSRWWWTTPTPQKPWRGCWTQCGSAGPRG